MLNLKLFQKNDEMLKKFEFQQNMKKKYLLFTLLYYNKKLCQFQNKRNYKLKGNILYILKNYRIFKLTRKITDKDQMSKINKFIKIRCYRKIKNLFVIIRETQGKKNHIAEYFKTFIRKMKVFKLMKKNYLNEVKKSSMLVHKFKIYYFKKKIFSLLINFYMIKLREKSIICKLKKLFKTKRIRLIRCVVDNWKRFFIVQKFRKIKKFQKKVKIFYLLKFNCKPIIKQNERDFFEGKI